MDPGPILETSQGEVPAPSLPFPTSAAGRLLYGLYVIITPILAFLGTEVIKPEWQSGRKDDYIALWLSPPANWLFILLLVYSVICYLFLLGSPIRSPRSFVVRFGVYTGTALALQYSIVTLMVFPGLYNSMYPVVGIIVLPLILWMAYQWARHQWGARTVNTWTFFLGVALVVAGAIWLRGQLFIVIIFGLTAVSPFWSLLLASRATLWLLRGHEDKLTFPRLLGIAAWLGAYALAWRISVLKMFELYAALPTSPPDCYIATAAAQGHPHFVHSEQLNLAGGKQISINPQLQRLKCFELTLLVTTPRLHSVLRSLYDLIGPMLVRYMKNPFIADMAYLVLVPFEWLSTLALRHLLPEFDAIADSIYIGRQK